MSTSIRQASFSAPMSAVVSASLTVFFFLVVGSGIWLTHAAYSGDIALTMLLRKFHMISGMIFALLGFVHMWNYRMWVLKIFESNPLSWRLHAQQNVIPLFALAFLMTIVTAVLVFAGVRGMVALHCGVALLFSVFTIFHIVINMGAPRQ